MTMTRILILAQLLTFSDARHEGYGRSTVQCLCMGWRLHCLDTQPAIQDHRSFWISHRHLLLTQSEIGKQIENGHILHSHFNIYIYICVMLCSGMSMCLICFLMRKLSSYGEFLCEVRLAADHKTHGSFSAEMLWQACTSHSIPVCSCHEEWQSQESAAEATSKVIK